MRQIIIEGHDGAGKTTFSNLLVENYRSRGFSVERLKFPSSYPSDDLLSRPSDLMLFYLNDFREGLAPFRENPVDILVIDRSFLSTMVYQCFQESENYTNDVLDENALRSMATLGSRIFTEGLDPVEVEIVLMSCEINTATRRMTERNSGEKDKLERMRSRDRYMKVRLLKDRYQVLKGVFRYGWYRPLEIGGNAFDIAKVIELDTTNLDPEQALKAYLQKSLEPEYFESAVNVKAVFE